MTEGTRYCPNCGQAYQEGQKFCGSCGRAVGPNAPPIPPEQGRIQIPTQAPPPQMTPTQYQSRGPGMWSGVKIGIGMFIILPILILLFLALVVLFLAAI